MVDKIRFPSSVDNMGHIENLSLFRYIRDAATLSLKHFPQLHPFEPAAGGGGGATDAEDEAEAELSARMELSHSLTLNEAALNQLPEQKRPVFIFEWLRFLDKVLVAAQKSDIKGCQKKLVEQLTQHIQGAPGPPTRKLIARCLATLFSVGDTFLLFETVNKCNDILKNKDDSPSYLPTRLAAICVVGCMYEKLGRMMGRSYEETVQILLKSLKNAESQSRIEIMMTLEKVCAGMGSAIANVHKDIYKAVRYCLTDRVMAVRVAASNCLLEMTKHAPFLYTSELESLASLCFRAFDSCNYEVRCAVAKLLGTLIACTQNGSLRNFSSMTASASSTKSLRPVSLDEALGVLMSGFLRGGVSFLKGTGEIIKGSSGVNREVRVGVTHAYVVFVQTMGGLWLERNLQPFLVHVLDLVANPKAASSHVDAVYSRKCINFILRSVIGKMLGEKAQSSACKELIHLIAKQMNSIDFNPENAKDSNQETLFSQHLLVCALQELGSLVLLLGTTAQNLLADQSLNFIDAICAVLIHPCMAARLAAAWCLRCVCVAVPSQITPLIDRFIEAIEKMRTSPDAISGYSGALAAVLGGVRYSPLGIPHTRGKIIFNTAEELLRTASQNSRLSLNRTQAGWLLIGAIMTLGVPVVKGLLPRMLLLWRNAFPRSTKELESEKARGDAFTWQVTLEGRAGALSVMHSFLLHCPELVTDDITRRLLTPIESALAMLINITSVLKNYGQHLKAPTAMVRLRLYETLSLLPANALESSYTHLLRMLVSEFTLTENPANTTTSFLRQMCHGDDSIILGTWLQDTDHRTIEDQMEPNRKADGDYLQPNSAAGSGALEHDACCLYRGIAAGEQCPGPLPLGVAVIDMSVILFGLIFPKVANKHRLQMLEHFGECIKHAKSSRQEAVQMNIFTALLSGLKGLTETKAAIGQEDVRKSATNLIIGALTSANPILRCAAGEALGRIAQVVGDSRVTAELAQTSFDRLKSARDVVTRTGHSLALGCLHRYVGGMGSSQHLNTSVSILLALAQDGSSPVVQVWSLYALSLIADSGGPMFRGYVEPSLSLALKLLLTVPQSHVDVHQCIGRVLSALITTIGPELQMDSNSVATARSSFLCAAAIMQAHSDPLVQAEATGCLQQLHLFAPRNVNLSSLVPNLCQNLSSNYLMLRKAAVSCLRQLTTREAKEVCEHAANLVSDEDRYALSDYGLPGVLFGMLDTESDSQMVRNIHDTITSMLQILAAENLSQWLSMCKNVLTVASDASVGADGGAAVGTTGAAGGAGTGTGAGSGAGATAGKDGTADGGDGDDGDDDDDDDDDNMEFHAEDHQATHPAVQPRWPTRVFAAECVRKVIATCENASANHFDLLAAKEMQMTKSRGDFLVLHLSDLIRMAFMAATSDSDQLRLEGLKTLQEIIDKFAHVPEPEFPGHLLLEQFQAQVGAALRPAFSQDTPSHVTAAACEVCSAWIGSGVARDLNDLRRVHQLLVSNLSKLNSRTNSTQLYNESMATLEKLSILKAWGQVYIMAMVGHGAAPASQMLKTLSTVGVGNHSSHLAVPAAAQPKEFSRLAYDDEFGDFESRGESLLSLVQPELENLSKHWLAALKDYALLSLPAEYASQLPHDGGAFYTNDTMNLSKPHYLISWPPILYAAALWLNAEGFQKDENHQQQLSREQEEDKANANDAPNTTAPKGQTATTTTTTISHGSPSADRFHLIFGICMEALCSTRTNEKLDSVIACLQSLYTVFDSAWSREMLMQNKTLPVELCNVLHRLILTRDSVEVQYLCISILKQTIAAANECLEREKEEERRNKRNASGADDANAAENGNSVTDPHTLDVAVDYLGEGGEEGEILPGKSLVYAVLEVVLCLLARQIPGMNPSQSTRVANEQLQRQLAQAQNGLIKLGDDNCLLVASAIQSLTDLPTLCSPRGALSILPTVLYLTTGVIKEVATKSIHDESLIASTNVVVQAAIQLLKVLATHRYAKHDDAQSGGEWRKLLQSALGRIIDLTKTGCEETKMDEVTVMLAIAVFLLHSPAGVASVPNLQYPCINHFRQCVQSASLPVRLKCVQTMRSIFANGELRVSTPYIHALAPRLIEHLYSEQARNPANEQELALVLEGITTVETLIALAEPQNRIQMLTLLVPILINYLDDPEQQPQQRTTKPKYVTALNDHAIQWLMKIGLKYPQEFKTFMAQAPELRRKLEAAIKRSQMNATLQKSKSEAANAAARNSAAQQQKPTIQLKTDFSNFSFA
ncbi:HEAT repeat-containing protein 5B isoform X2 [Anopheles stephensi]|uniref:HEAT repeat-containing protein 5B isoform X2 n=1 Tax=Anopheles stephensi TaxID=30069 RepID=UPI001658B368|nr:HEAT repeat-containing protein 5B isoform X2 [Anopheles stephensi]